jgi:hypothetical protein
MLRKPLNFSKNNPKLTESVIHKFNLIPKLISIITAKMEIIPKAHCPNRIYFACPNRLLFHYIFFNFFVAAVHASGMNIRGFYSSSFSK